MHSSSYNLMARFVSSIAEEQRVLTVLDIGSMDVNGSYRPLFPDDRFRYVGVDVAPGKNVDIVLSNPYKWHELEDKSADIIVSGQALEHIEFPWLTINQMAKKLKANGRLFVIAPSKGFMHRHPVDCYRYFPDGMRALAKWAGLDVCACSVDVDGQFGDCWMEACRSEIFKMPKLDHEHCLHADNPLRLNKGNRYYSYVRNDVLETIKKSKIVATSILDVGCGNGVVSRGVRELLLPATYSGIELDNIAAAAASANGIYPVWTENIDGGSNVQDIIEQDKYDLILMLDVLEHMYNPWDTLASLTSVLRPGGHVVISLPNVRHKSVSERNWEYQKQGILDSSHIRFFTQQTIKKLVDGAGLASITWSNTFIGQDGCISVTEDPIDANEVYQYIVVAKKI